MKRLAALVAVITLGATAYTLTGHSFSAAPDPTYFAEIENGTVVRVLVISPQELATGKWGNPSKFVQTYIDGGPRKNYAGPGFKYDTVRDAFIPPKVDKNDIFDEDTATWRPAKAATTTK